MFGTELDTQLNQLGLGSWLPDLHDAVRYRLSSDYHGDIDKWRAALACLPQLTPTSIDLASAVVRVGEPGDITDAQHGVLEQSLRQLHPWRKGPFELFGLTIDTEWRSDWKWDRLKNHITPLAGRAVLDIGCGSGYHCWRMRGAGARFVLGIDPTLLFVMQFSALQQYIGDAAVHVLPLGLEDLPAAMNCFDTVFSMGLLYHRRDPLTHLTELRECLRDGGELVLETLVIEDSQGTVLIPEGRYAQMRNVWCLPSLSTLLEWLDQAGFKNAHCVDVTVTSIQEQRSTDWMRFQSLSDYLDPNNPAKTAEGYPAPIRAICIARK